MMKPHNKLKAESTMDLYGNKVSFGGTTVARTPVRVVKVDIEIGPIGCMACTSGDSPILDFEQNVLFGY